MLNALMKIDIQDCSTDSEQVTEKKSKIVNINSRFALASVLFCSLGTSIVWFYFHSNLWIALGISFLLPLVAIYLNTRQKHALADTLPHPRELASTQQTLLMNMSHELRTPLNGITGSLELLNDLLQENEQKELAATAIRSSDELLKLIDNLLDFATIDSGNIKIQTITFSLSHVIEAVADLLTAKATEKNLEFVVSIAPGVPQKLLGDPGRIRQILMNITANAIKFTPSGEVSIRVACEPSTTTTRLFRFSVTDTGIGIDDSHQDAIFNDFSQADSSSTRAYGGMGLGLSLARELVQLMNGTMGVSSHLGSGSCFWFCLPLALQEKQGKPDPKMNRIGFDKTVRVLIVDDNATSRFILSEQLSAWGISHDVMGDASSALHRLYTSQLSDNPFRIVFIDKDMPSLDGLALGRAIQKDAGLENLLMFLFVSSGHKGDAERAKEAGFSAYITKPIRQAALIEAISLVLKEADSLHPSTTLITRHSVAEAVMNRSKVLLIEDDVGMRRAICLILMASSVEVTIVRNWEEARRQFDGEQFRLILINNKLAVGNNTFIKSIRDAGATTVIGMSEEPLDSNTLNENGYQSSLGLPPSRDQLLEVIDRWINHDHQD